MFRSTLVCAVLAAGVAVGAQAQDKSQDAAAEAACALARTDVNAHEEFAATNCVVTHTSHALNLFFSTTSNVFDDAGRTGIYTHVIAGAVGAALDKSPRLPVARIYVMDRSLGERRTAWRIEAGELRRLQRELRAKRMSPEQFDAGVQLAGKVGPLDTRE
jgi:hypothetical protein